MMMMRWDHERKEWTDKEVEERKMMAVVRGGEGERELLSTAVAALSVICSSIFFTCLHTGDHSRR